MSSPNFSRPSSFLALIRIGLNLSGIENTNHLCILCWIVSLPEWISFICGYGEFVMKSTNAAFLKGVRINHYYLEIWKGPSEVVFGELLINEQKLVEICSLDLTDL